MQQKSTALEYSANYRTAENHANKVTVKANAKPKSSHAEANLEETLPINVDTISTSRLATKKIGLYKVVFACIMLALAIAGIIALFSALIRTAAVMSNSPTNAKCKSYIAPVVMHDPPPFEDSSHLDANVKVATSIWRDIFQNGSSTYKERDADGLTLMPASDMQSGCAELFGPNTTTSTGEAISEQFFSHTAGDEYFHIGTISNSDSLVPHIDSITENNENLNLAVSYLARDDKYFNAGEDKTDTPSPVKRTVYNLRLDEATNKDYIQSVLRPYP